VDKKTVRHRRATRPRIKIRELGVHRLCVHRTPRHIYAQVIAPDGGHTLVSASTLEPDVRKEVAFGGNVSAAKIVGRLVAERAKNAGIEAVAFDRSGFRFHGRVKALADAAREAGLRF
jgi:large subunit ribosomal protein L18